MKRRPTGPQVKVNVTPDNIETAVPQNSSHCMIADAIKTAYPGAGFVAVDISTIRFTDSEKRQRYTFLTPRRAQVAILQFDQGIKPVPFEFILRKAHVTVSGKKLKGEGGAVLVGRKDLSQPPRRVGGKTPPRLPATRREFGIRAFGYIAALATDQNQGTKNGL